MRERAEKDALKERKWMRKSERKHTCASSHPSFNQVTQTDEPLLFLKQRGKMTRTLSSSSRKKANVKDGDFLKKGKKSFFLIPKVRYCFKLGKQMENETCGWSHTPRMNE